MPRFLKITPERTHIPALHNHSKLWIFQKKNRTTCRIFCCRRLLDSSCLVLKELRRNNKSFYLFRRKHLCDFKQTSNFGTQCLY